MKRLISTLLVTILISGCATNYAKTSSADVTKAVRIKNTNFDPAISFIGPPATSTTSRGIFEDNQTVHLVVSQDKKTKLRTYVVLVTIMYPFDWRFYRSVSFSDSTSTNLELLDQSVLSCQQLGCIHSEEVGFAVALPRLLSGDLTFRLKSQKGVENIITLPKSYIDGVLAAVPFNN